MERVKDRGKKGQGQQDRITTPPKVSGVDHALFSFKHITANNNHSFAYFGGKESRDAREAYHGLFQKMNEISKKSMIDLRSCPKETGYERLPYRRFSKSMQGVLDSTGIVDKDNKLAVFRFCDDYRMICVQDDNSQNIFHIIGFDFNFSAYDHG